jgi:hypothetical protein
MAARELPLVAMLKFPTSDPLNPKKEIPAQAPGVPGESVAKN